MAGPLNFTGQNIEDSYQRVLQTDGTIITDGTGSFVNLQFSGSFSGSYVGDGSGLTGITLDDTGIQAQIDVLQSDLVTVTTATSANTSNIGNLQTDVANLQADVEDLATSIIDINTDVTGLIGDTTNLQFTASLHQTDIDQLQSDVLDRLLISSLSTTTVGTASFVTSSNVQGPLGFNSIATASYVPIQQGAGITVSGMSLSANLRKVNGNEPDPITGNVAVSLAAVLTGTSASLASYATGSLAEGTVWIISNDTADKNGDSYVFDSGSVGVWYQIAPLDQTAADARYARISTATVQQLTSSFAISTSFATTASYALNGGVTSISVAGSGLSINQSTGAVTITGTGGGGGGGATFPYIGNALITGSLISVRPVSYSFVTTYPLNNPGAFTPIATPFNINGVTFYFTGSPAPANTTDTIYVVSGSTNSNTAAAFVLAFNASQSIAPYSTKLQYLSASRVTSTVTIAQMMTQPNWSTTGATSLYTVFSGVTRSFSFQDTINTLGNVVVTGSLLVSGGVIDGPIETSRDLIANGIRVGRGNGNSLTNGVIGALAFGRSVGFYNTAIGYAAMFTASSGNYNNAIGYKALESASAPENSVAIGGFSMQYARNPLSNTGIGLYALQEFNRYNTGSRGNNVTIGTSTMRYADWTNFSVAIGAAAMSFDNGSDFNVGIGYLALGDTRKYIKYNSTISSVSFGGTPLSASISSLVGVIYSGSTAASLAYLHPKASFKISASFNDPTDAARTYTIVSSSNGAGNGSFTITLDSATPLNAGISWSLEDSDDYGISSNNVAIGTRASQWFAGGPVVGSTAYGGRGTGGNLAIGYAALRGVDRTALAVGARFKTGSYGTYNTAVGYQSLHNLYRGNFNLAIGYNAMFGFPNTPIEESNSNVAIGNSAMTYLSSSNNNNIAIGNNAMNGNNTSISNASNNVIIGTLAARNMNGGSNNQLIGYQAGNQIGQGAVNNLGIGYNVLNLFGSGSENIALGTTAMFSARTGSFNVSIGANTSYNIVSGSYNTLVGHNAGQYLQSSASNNIVIGYGAGPHTTTSPARSLTSSLWIGATTNNAITTSGPFLNFNAPLIGGSMEEKFVYIYNRLGLGQATASYLIDALAAPNVDAVMSFDGGGGANNANARFLVSADTATKTAGLFFRDRNGDRIETGNAVLSGSAYVYLERTTGATVFNNYSTDNTRAFTAQRNDLIYINTFPGKGHHFAVRNPSSDTTYKGDVIMTITGSSGVIIRSGSLSIPTGSLTMSGSLTMTGSLRVQGQIVNPTISGSLIVSGTSFFSGSLVPSVPATSFTSSFTLGTPTAAWKKVYVGEGSIEFVNGSGVEVATISVQPDGAVKVPSLYTEGNITVNTIVSQSTTYVVANYYATGSNQFGSSSLDTHQFTGSVFISGAMYVSNVQPAFGYNIITFDTGSGRLYYTSSLSLVGPQGSIGPAGPSGSQGPAGPQGIQGETGLTGAQGAQGEAGTPGLQGEIGPIGPTGPQGEQGLQGETGPQGEQGVAGVGFTNIDANNAAIEYNTQITGSLNVTGGITGSLFGIASTSSYIDPVYISASAASYGFGSGGGAVATSSWAIQAITSSIATSSSFASTASFVNRLNQNVIVTGSVNVSGSIAATSFTGSLRGHVVTSSIDTIQNLLYADSAVVSVNWGSRGLLDSSEISSVLWNDRTLKDASGDYISVDWSNRNLLDGSEAQSIDWGGRSLYTPNGGGALSWGNYDYVTESDIYSRQNIRNGKSEELTNTLYDYSGQSLRATVDGTSNSGELVFLDTDNVWYPVDQTASTSRRMLGINLNGSDVLIEGDITLDTIQAANYGLPVFIRQGGSTLSTNIPTSGYVRVVGHCYHDNGTTPGQWLLKFRPSNDWYEI